MYEKCIKKTMTTKVSTDKKAMRSDREGRPIHVGASGIARTCKKMDDRMTSFCWFQGWGPKGGKGGGGFGSCCRKSKASPIVCVIRSGRAVECSLVPPSMTVSRFVVDVVVVLCAVEAPAPPPPPTFSIKPSAASPRASLPGKPPLPLLHDRRLQGLRAIPTLVVVIVVIPHCSASAFTRVHVREQVVSPQALGTPPPRRREATAVKEIVDVAVVSSATAAATAALGDGFLVVVAQVRLVVVPAGKRGAATATLGIVSSSSGGGGARGGFRPGTSSVVAEKTVGGVSVDVPQVSIEVGVAPEGLLFATFVETSPLGGFAGGSLLLLLLHGAFHGQALVTRTHSLGRDVVLLFISLPAWLWLLLRDGRLVNHLWALITTTTTGIPGHACLCGASPVRSRTCCGRVGRL